MPRRDAAGGGGRPEAGAAWGGAAPDAAAGPSVGRASMAAALLGWSQPRVETGPALEDGTRAVALVALVLMVPALYVDMPSYVGLISGRSVVLPLIPSLASGVVSVLLGTLLFLIGAYASDVAAPLDAISRRRFYSIATLAVGLGVLLVGLLLPSAIWELSLLLLYCLPGIIGVYAVALGSARLAYLLFALVAAAVLVDRSFLSGWAGPAVLGVTLLVFMESLDAHARLTRAMRAEVDLQRGLAGGGAPDSVVRSNYVVIQRRFLVVLGRTVAVAAAVSLAAVLSVGVAAWATGGALPESLEARTMSGLAVPSMVALVAVLAFHINRSGRGDLFTVAGRPAEPTAEPMGPPVGIFGEAAPEEPPLTLLQRMRGAPRRLIARVATPLRRGARGEHRGLPWDGSGPE